MYVLPMLFSLGCEFSMFMCEMFMPGNTFGTITTDIEATEDNI